MANDFGCHLLGSITMGIFVFALQDGYFPADLLFSV
jgi:hypothetical protein